MTKSDVYEIAIKIFGIYLFCVALSLLSQLLLSFSIMLNQVELDMGNSKNGGQEYTAIFIVSLIHWIFILLTSYFFIFKTKLMLGWISDSSDATSQLDIHISRRSLFEIALVITGFFVVFMSIPDVAFSIRSLMYIASNEILTSSSRDQEILFFACTKIILGLCLLFFSKRIVGFFYKE